MAELKILAVDDDEIILRLLSEVLTKVGYADVRTCANPRKALQMVRSDPDRFDCFLLDIQMPGIDGIDLCRAIRNTRGYDSTPILMLTALSEKTYVDRAFQAGATDYLTKPFEPTEVAVRLGLARQLVEERRMLSDNIEIVDSFIEAMERTTRHDLIEPIDLGKMDGLLCYPAFENYLCQTGRAVFFLANVFAVKIRNVENWYRKLPPLEFKELLRQSAQEIIDRLDGQEVFLSYRGNGEFVGVIPRNSVRALDDLGDKIDIEVLESEGPYGATLPSHLRLIIGPAVTNRLPTRGGLLKNIWSALEKVRQKEDPDGMRETSPRAGRRSGQDAGVENPEDFTSGGLKAEFQEFLEEKLQHDIGEFRLRDSKMNAAAIKLFRYENKKRAKTAGRDKKLFGSSSTTKPAKAPVDVGPSHDTPAGGGKTKAKK